MNEHFEYNTPLVTKHRHRHLYLYQALPTEILQSIMISMMLLLQMMVMMMMMMMIMVNVLHASDNWLSTVIVAKLRKLESRLPVDVCLTSYRPRCCCRRRRGGLVDIGRKIRPSRHAILFRRRRCPPRSAAVGVVSMEGRRGWEGMMCVAMSP